MAWCNPDTGTRNPKPGTRNLKPGTRNTKHETCNPEPDTRNPKPETPNPAPYQVRLELVLVDDGGTLNGGIDVSEPAYIDIQVLPTNQVRHPP